MTELADLKPKAVEKMIEDNIVMIDVRRPMEWETTGLVPSSHKLTFFDDYGNYDVEKWMNEFQKLVPSKNQTFVLICARGNRTRTIGNFLIDQGYKYTAHLYGGINLWMQELKETVKN